MSVYNRYVKQGNEYHPIEFGGVVESLPSGCYKFEYDWELSRGWFEPMEFKSDKIVDLPSVEYTQLTQEMKYFLKPETKAKFEQMGYLYKRSSLLHGAPGAGKTILVNRVAKDVVAIGGIVLFNPHPAFIEKAYDYLNQIQPDVLTLVVLEELDVHISDQENELLHLLDGESQKKNVMYIATTNFIDRIPSRICRPGRFSTLLEVHYPSEEARFVYLATKLNNDRAKIISELTNGFSIDDLKEVVLSTECLGYSLDNVIARIRLTKGMVQKLPEDRKQSKVRQEMKNMSDQIFAPTQSLSAAMRKR